MSTEGFVKVAEITYAEPGNSLPLWVRRAASERGYADALDHPLSLIVTDPDIADAFACAAMGDGMGCVMAQAARRLGAKAVYFYRTTAWVDFGSGPIVRYAVPEATYRNIIEPFDRGDRENVIPGVYPVVPPKPSNRLSAIREVTAKRGKRPKVGTGEALPVVHQHSERVVMASWAE